MYYLLVPKVSTSFRVLLMLLKCLKWPLSCVPMYCTCTEKKASKWLRNVSELYRERPHRSSSTFRA